ncbi:MAG: alpha/beta hydrolase [Clostridia bacterium]|nr:alpha/beta hydrolase [Clostridia bacterium]
MPYQYRTFTYASSDGKNHIAAHLYTPTDKAVRGIVQIAHDLCDYTERYERLAEVLCHAGYALCGGDFLGHGKTVRHSSDLGFFASEDGADTLVTDLHKLTLLLRAQFKGAPIILTGVGMGAFVTRIAATSYYRDIDGVALLSPAQPPLPFLFRMIGNRIARKQGERAYSPFLDRVVFGFNNWRIERFDAVGRDWLSRDEEVVAAAVVDPLCNFRPTALAYADLFLMAERAASAKWGKDYPKSMPTFIAAGDADPVGRYGKAPAAISARYSSFGVKDVTLHLYAGARHDLVNDTESETFFEDFTTWIVERF